MAFVPISSSESELLLAVLEERESVDDEDDWRECDFCIAGAWE